MDLEFPNAEAGGELLSSAPTILQAIVASIHPSIHLSIYLAPYHRPDSTMGACISTEDKDRERSARIDRSIEEDAKRFKKECKILLLGK